jgi:uncharacterized protein YceH (UPF0502 family)
VSGPPQLGAGEARVIGCLLEKQVTTPEQYPLSLNALVNACNQKSNRDPLLQLGEAEVQALVDGLARRHMVMERGGFGSRVPKYQQTFCNTEFGQLRFTPQELAIVCELLLRGPQTPGELRSRAARMAPFVDSGEVDAALAALAARSDGPVVRMLPREPGRRDSRWAQLYTPLPEAAGGPVQPAHELSADAVEAVLAESEHPDLLERVAKLEDLVETLRLQLLEMKRGPEG